MRLLFIRFSSIGDIVFTTPAIRCAKQQIPGVTIHFLTKKNMKAVTEANPYIDHFHYFDKDIKSTINDLKQFDFDYVIDLHKNFRTFRIKKGLGVPSLTYQKLSWQKLLLTKLHINLMPHRHIVDRCIDTLTPLGVVNDQQSMDYFVPENVTLRSNDIPTSHQLGYVALVIGASYASKKLPVAQLRTLCALIPYPIILIGGKEDQEEGNQIANVDSVKVYNACGKFNLHESALLIKGAKTVVSHDTGMLYIACAYHKKVVAIWGATSPALQVKPYGAPAHFNSIVEGLSCQPCSNYGTKQCPQGHFACMKKQDLLAIQQKVMEYYQD
jgi:ADP-heptose:LPS heptosyltransferase